MTPESAAAATSTPVLERRAPVPPEPTTIEDTGLSVRSAPAAAHQGAPRRRAKRPRAGREALPAVRAARVAARPPAGREADRGARSRRVGHGGLPLRAHRPGTRARGDGLRGQRLRRARPGAAAPVHRRDAQVEGGTRLPHEGTHRRGLHAPGREPADARPARSGRQLGQVDLPLRPSRQRQDGRGRRHRPRAGRRHVRAVGARHRRPDHHHLRPGEPHAARRRGAPPAA